jgi:ABC-type lipoprotein release transport system permease subunit
MERIKRFLLDDSGTAEATSTVIMIAAVGILLGAALAVYYGSVNNFFTSAGAGADGYAGRIAPAF